MGLYGVAQTKPWDEFKNQGWKKNPWIYDQQNNFPAEVHQHQSFGLSVYIMPLLKYHKAWVSHMANKYAARKYLYDSISRYYNNKILQIGYLFVERSG